VPAERADRRTDRKCWLREPHMRTDRMLRTYGEKISGRLSPRDGRNK